jgi:hypothetical protein
MIWTCKHDLCVNASPLPCRLVDEGTWVTNTRQAFTCFAFRGLGKVININSCFSTNQADILVSMFNRRLAWIIVVNERYREKPHMDKYKITNDWNYDASCMLTSLPVWESDNFKRLVFVVECTTFQKTVIFRTRLDSLTESICLCKGNSDEGRLYLI